VAAHMMVDQLLERHQIVGQDFVGRLQNDLMREISAWMVAGRVQCLAVAVGNKKGNDEAAADDQTDDGQQQSPLTLCSRAWPSSRRRVWASMRRMGSYSARPGE